MLDLEFTPAAETSVELDSKLDIPVRDNLAVRAAERVFAETGATGRLRIRLEKRIPPGGGLGGGSSDAAAVLLALPVLAGVDLPLAALIRMAAELGSDVPFFLLGGAALGLGRGTEIHPLPDAPAWRGLLVSPGVEISTAEAYRALGRQLTPVPQFSNIDSFQALSWSLGYGFSATTWAALSENDFEAFAFQRYPQLNWIRGQLRERGAEPVMLSGSGATLFGMFRSKEQAEQARSCLSEFETESFYLVSRGRYRRIWWRNLRGHLMGEQWPPRSRYVR